jgi:septal ring factor EnvC (AmiA/AmiB activator)
MYVTAEVKANERHHDHHVDRSDSHGLPPDNDRAAAALSKKQADLQFLENYTKLVAILAERDNQITDLRGKIHELESKISRLEISLADSAKAKSDLEKEVAVMNARIADLQGQVLPPEIIEKIVAKSERAESLPCSDCPAKMMSKSNKGE